MTPDNQTSAALKRYEFCRDVDPTDPDKYSMREKGEGRFVTYADHIAALASRQQGEAVAWMHPESPGTCISAREYADSVKYGWGKEKHYTVPLYTAPPALPAPALPVAHPSVTEALKKTLAHFKAMPKEEFEKLLDEPVGDVGQFILDTHAAPALSEGLTEVVKRMEVSE